MDRVVDASERDSSRLPCTHGLAVDLQHHMIIVLNVPESHFVCREATVHRKDVCPAVCPENSGYVLG